MQHFFPPRISYGYKYFEVSIIRPIDAEQDLVVGSRRSQNHHLVPVERDIQAQGLEKARQDEEMTKFLQEFDNIDEVIREEVHRTEETT